MSHHDDHSSTNPDEGEQQRVDDLPSGTGDATSGDDDAHEDTASGGAPEQPDA